MNSPNKDSLFWDESQGLLLLPNLAHGLLKSETNFDVLLREVGDEIRGYSVLHQKLLQHENSELEDNNAEDKAKSEYLARLQSLQTQLEDWRATNRLPETASRSHENSLQIDPEKSNMLYLAFGTTFQDALSILDTCRVEFTVLEEEGGVPLLKTDTNSLVEQYCCANTGTETSPSEMNKDPGTTANVIIIHILESLPPIKGPKETPPSAIQQLPYLRIRHLLDLINLQLDETGTLLEAAKRQEDSSSERELFRPKYEATVDLHAWYCLCDAYQACYKEAFDRIPAADASSAFFEANVLTAKFTPTAQNHQLFRLLHSTKSKHLAKLPICPHLLACVLLATNLASLSQNYTVRSTFNTMHFL